MNNASFQSYGEELSMEHECVSELSDEWSARATSELGETPDKVRRGLATMRSLMETQPSVQAKVDDAFLLRFLRAKKFNFDEAFALNFYYVARYKQECLHQNAFKKLLRYYGAKAASPELFVVPRPSDKLHVLEAQAQTMLPHRNGNGCRVYIYRMERCDLSAISVDDVFLTNLMAFEWLACEARTQVAGMIFLLDMTGFSIHQHYKLLSPHYVRKAVELIQESFPLRFKGFHVVNQPLYFDGIFAVVKPFLTVKIRGRIFFHGKNLRSLHAHISPDILPAEYGGKQAHFDNTAWRNALLEWEATFVELESYGHKLPANNAR